MYEEVIHMSRYLARLSTVRDAAHEPCEAITVIEFAGGDGAWLDYLLRSPWLGLLGFVECADDGELAAFTADYPDRVPVVESCGNIARALVVRPDDADAFPSWLSAACLPYSAPEFAALSRRDGFNLPRFRDSWLDDLYDRMVAAGLGIELPVSVIWSGISHAIELAVYRSWASSLSPLLFSVRQIPLFSRLLACGYSVDEALDAFVALGATDRARVDRVVIPGASEDVRNSVRAFAFDYRAVVLAALFDECDVDRRKADELIAREASDGSAMGLLYAVYSLDAGRDALAFGGSALPAIAAKTARYMPDVYRLPMPQQVLVFEAVGSGCLDLEELPVFRDGLESCVDAYLAGVPVSDIFA